MPQWYYFLDISSAANQDEPNAVRRLHKKGRLSPTLGNVRLVLRKKFDRPVNIGLDGGVMRIASDARARRCRRLVIPRDKNRNYGKSGRYA